jgi:hypothetical protein
MKELAPEIKLRPRARRHLRRTIENWYDSTYRRAIVAAERRRRRLVRVEAARRARVRRRATFGRLVALDVGPATVHHCSRERR